MPDENVEEMHEIAGELVSLSIKAGRRIAYDLRHAVDEIPEGNSRKKRYRERSDYFLELFSIDSGIKDYRHSLQQENMLLEMRNESMLELLKENNVDIPISTIILCSQLSPKS